MKFLPVQDVKMAIIIPKDVRWGSPRYRDEFRGRRLLLMETRLAGAAGAAQRVAQVDLDTLAQYLSSGDYNKYAETIAQLLSTFPEALFYPYSPEAAHMQALIDDIRAGEKPPEAEQGGGGQTTTTTTWPERLLSPTHTPAEEQDVRIMSPLWWSTICRAIVTAVEKSGIDPLDTTPPETDKPPLHQPVIVWKDWSYIEQRFTPSDPKLALIVKSARKWRLLLKLKNGRLEEPTDSSQISEDAKQVLELAWKAFFRQMTPIAAHKEYREAAGERSLISII